MAVILIIDDSAIQRKITRYKIQKEGYEVIEAMSGAEGMQIITSQTPDCIVLDLIMPGMDGIEFLKAISEKGYGLPIIVMSADLQPKRRKRCLDLGVCDFIRKPPEEEELTNAIKKALDAKQEI